MGVTTIKTTVDLIISVLCTASSRLNHIPYDSSLCTQETLNTLVRACKVAFRKRITDASWDAQGAPHVLSHIISERNFVPLLKHDFVFQVYEMARPTMQHFNCDTCEAVGVKLLIKKKTRKIFLYSLFFQQNKYVGAGLLDLLNKIAETGYGRGEMAHLLLKDDKQMNKQVSIISAMLIRLVKCGPKCSIKAYPTPSTIYHFQRSKGIEYSAAETRRPLLNNRYDSHKR